MINSSVLHLLDLTEQNWSQKKKCVDISKPMSFSKYNIFAGKNPEKKHLWLM